MNVTIVSTYPENGTKNIGDQLITDRTIDFVKKTFPNKELNIRSVWRAESWDVAKTHIMAADLVIFACLAIRFEMSTKEYPYLNKVVKSGRPYCVLAAGTALPVSYNVIQFNKALSSEANATLKKVNDKALFFTTRGCLSQFFCERIGLNNSRFSGDIAFYDNRFANRRFNKDFPINKIAISDPHGGMRYYNCILNLVRELKVVFPEANIVFFFHGLNNRLLKRLEEDGFECEKLYDKKHDGLDLYDEVDLHVGFRVHGHVSALSRRKVSYLLEQDGRGLDYGLTYDSKITSKCFIKQGLFSDLINKIVDKVPMSIPYVQVESGAIYEIVSIIKKDHEDGFKKFDLIETQLNSFNRNFEKLSRDLACYFESCK